MEIFPYEKIKRYIFPYMDTNMYVLAENGEALVIDPHISAEAAGYLDACGVEKVTVLLTHEHFDHICGIPWLRAHYRTRVICQEEALDARRQRYFCRPVIVSLILSDRDEEEKREAFEAEYSAQAFTAEETFGELLDMDWQGHTLHLEHLPGHSPASSLIILDEVYVFAGDSLIPDAEPTIRWPWSDAETYRKKAVPRLMEIQKQAVIFPGHRDAVKMEQLVCEKDIFRVKKWRESRHRNMQDLVIFGAGGMAKETATLTRDINRQSPTFRHVAYVVDSVYFQEGMEIHGVPVYSREWLLEHKADVVCACAVGYPKQRRAIQKNLMEEGVRFTNLVHPSTWWGEGTVIGKGCIIRPGCSISDDCRIGDGVFLNGDVIIGHDIILEDYVTCFPRCQISGHVQIAEAACIGSMSFINEKRKIGAEAVIAPGSIVFANVKAGTHVIGNPAKRIEL